VPAVPRTFHHGVRGTFMDPALHERYFGRIAHSTDASVRWPAAEYTQMRARLRGPAYESELRARIAATRPLVNLNALLTPPDEDAPDAFALWYDMAPRDGSSTVFKELANAFGLWHEMRRGSHNGVHELWCRGHPVLLVNLRYGAEARESPYHDLAPTEQTKPSTVFRTGAHVKAAVKKLRRAARPKLCPPQHKSATTY